MRVLLITVRSDIGGGPKHVFDLLSHGENNEVDYYVAAPLQGSFSCEFKGLSGGFFEIPFRKFSFLSFFRLLSFVRKNQISIIHSHGRGAGLYSRMLRIFGCKVIHTFHGVHVRKDLVGKVKIFMDKALVPLTDKFICVSNSEKKSALKHGVASDPKSIVINNGVKLYGSEGINKGRKVIVGSIGRFDKVKGFDVLIDYINKFEKKNDYDYEVWLAGDGEEFKHISQLVYNHNLENKIKLLGFTNNPVKFLRKIDFYISFSRSEGLPISVLEAMSCGIPCLLSKVVGNKDIVEHEKNGLLFTLDSYESFEFEFKKLLKPEYRNKFVKPSLKTIKSRFSVNEMCENTYGVYKNL